MAKVSLIVPNIILRDSFGDISDPPIGIASIAGYLERKGFEILIIDAMGENLTEQQIVQKIIDFKPKFIGIGCNYSPLHNPTLALSKTIKSHFDNSIFIFVGGNHATCLKEHLLMQSKNTIDCIVRGEGEIATFKLLNALQEGDDLSVIPSVTFQKEGKIVNNPSLPLSESIDDFGMPAYHLLPMSKYRRYNIISMRGCPFSCTFCASTALFGQKVRYKSVSIVIKEIEYLLTNYGYRPFWFSDDTFTINKSHSSQLLNEIINRKLSIEWSCLTTVHTVQKELLEHMLRAGCCYISYGIESGSPEMLRCYVGKKISVEGIINTSRITHEVGLRHYGFFIIGFPGETWDSIYDTYSLVLQSKMNGGGMNILIPLPGTSLWHQLYEKRNAFNLDEMKWDELFARLPNEAHQSFAAQLASRWCKLSPDELIEACKCGQHLFNTLNHKTMATSIE
jgi:anaerobic magnesium-protoporphyrin IX monomethyl ester cyclase